MNFLNRTKLIKLRSAEALGGTALQSDPLDLAGCRGAVFLTALSVANPGNSIFVSQSIDGIDWGPLEGARLVPEAAGELLALEVHWPEPNLGHWLRLEVDRSGANTAVEPIYAALYSPRKQPVSQPAGTRTLLVISPDLEAP